MLKPKKEVILLDEEIRYDFIVIKFGKSKSGKKRYQCQVDNGSFEGFKNCYLEFKNEKDYISFNRQFIKTKRFSAEVKLSKNFIDGVVYWKTRIDNTTISKPLRKQNRKVQSFPRRFKK